MRGTKKQLRQKMLIETLEKNPFMTDEELAEALQVSVPTIRLDRSVLNIAEHRQRIRQMASGNYDKVTTLKMTEIVGELLDITPGQNAVSLLVTDQSMVFQNTRVVRGNCIYSMAETLSIAAIDAPGALVKVANIKYKKPVYSGANLIAKAQVREDRGSEFIVWVFIYENREEVFRGKFILCPVKKEEA